MSSMNNGKNKIKLFVYISNIAIFAIHLVYLAIDAVHAFAPGLIKSDSIWPPLTYFYNLLFTTILHLIFLGVCHFICMVTDQEGIPFKWFYISALLILAVSYILI